MGRKSVLYVVDHFSGVTWYRCQTPGDALQRRGYEVAIDEPSNTKLGRLLEAADVIVLERLPHPAGPRIVEWAKQNGRRVMCDIDDDLWTLDPDNPGHKFWSKPENRANLEWCLRNVDAITTTTPRLAKLLSAFNRNVHIVPNMLPDEFWPDPPPRPEKELISVGWAGSASHLPDLRLLRGVVESLLEQRKNVEFVFAGILTLPFAAHHRMRMLDSVLVMGMHDLLMNFDIGLAPVADTRFNACKSDLKVLEYAAVGIPVVASDVAPYRGSIAVGKTGFLADNGKEWLKHILRLVDDEQLRRDMGAAGRAWAQTRMIEQNLDEWERVLGLGDAG